MDERICDDDDDGNGNESDLVIFESDENFVIIAVDINGSYVNGNDFLLKKCKKC